jgi:murein DD-endopeptidase MepM/ murein hydrolase activator NlpD
MTTFRAAVLIAVVSMVGPGVSAAAASAAIPMQLPFPVGQVWQANGPHPYNGVSGIRNALDFGRTDGSTGTVVAAAAGRVSLVRNCGGGYEVRIDHADGWQTGYYHLSAVSVAQGAQVAMGQLIGATGQGCGAATFRHVHFYIRRNGSDVNVDGLSIGGNTVHAKSYNYGGWWTRNSDGAKVAEDVGGNARCCLTSYAVNPGVNPVGAYDTLLSPEPGVLRVRGWSFDADAKTTPLAMHVYVGGQAGQPGVTGYAFTANRSRPDVGAAYPGVGNNHGLDETFETSKRGSQPVCLYAINVGGGGNVLLGCKTVTIADPNPYGHFDSVSSPVGGSVHVAGWAVDPSDPTRSISMQVYVGGSAG